MHPALRRQNDLAQEEYSRRTAIDTTDLPDRTRQEDAPAADINLIMRRFLATGDMSNLGFKPSPQYTETDYTMDLRDALTAAEQAQRVHDSMPDEVRRRYPTWQSMLTAVASGQLKYVPKEETQRDEKPEETEPTP